MFQLVYISSATVPFSKADLLSLLAESRANNAKCGLTGMLLYKEGNFMQALEGEEGAVRRTHARIERDPRHKGLITLLAEPIAGRRFAEWTMALRDLGSPEVHATPGFNAFLNTPLTGMEFAGKERAGERLLLTFKKCM